MRNRSSLFILALFVLLVLSASPVSAYEFGHSLFGSLLYGGVESNVVGNSSVLGLASAGVSECLDYTPVHSPWLYAAVPQNDNSIMIYFQGPKDSFDHFDVIYGSIAGNYPYAGVNIAGEGRESYRVRGLNPGSRYYFRVRAVNGCAPGPWSEELSAATKSLVSFNTLVIENSELQPIAETKKTEDQYVVNVKVVSENGEAIVGANITLTPGVLSASTDENGIVRFADVSAGEYEVRVEKGGYRGSESVNLQGEVKEFSITVKVKPQKVLFTPESIVIIAALGLLLITSMTFVVARRRVPK